MVDKKEYPKEYKLTFFERLMFQTIYPQKGNYTELLLRDKLMEKLISQEERDQRQIEPVWQCTKCGEEIKSSKKPECPKCKGDTKESGRVAWNMATADGKDIPDEKVISLGEMSVTTIIKALKELDEAKALQPQHKSLYLKIVLDGKVPEVED